MLGIIAITFNFFMLFYILILFILEPQNEPMPVLVGGEMKLTRHHSSWREYIYPSRSAKNFFVTIFDR